MDLVKLREKLMPVIAAFLPLFELYCARSIHRQRVDFYNDPGFMIGLGIAFFGLYLIYRDFGELRLQKKILMVNLLLLILPFARYTVAPIHVEWIGFVWFAIVMTAFCVFADPRRIFLHFYTHRALFAFVSAVYVAQVAYHSMRYIKWFNKHMWYEGLAKVVVGTTRFLLDVLQYNILPVTQPRTIRHPDFTIYINAACSGLEGVVFFVAVFSCMMMLDYKTIPMRKIIIGYAVGIVLMMALNILRILLFFMFGVWAVQHWGGGIASKVVVDLFHNNIGWLLYMLGIAAFFFFFYEYVDKDKKKPPA